MQVTPYIQDLTLRLRRATISRDYDALAAIDREAQLVAVQLARHKLKGDARSALALLVASHREATQMLETELGRLTSEMMRVNRRRTGCQAYARQGEAWAA